jgi:hypothetical protein
MVATAEGHDMEKQFFGSVVLGSAEDHIKSNSATTTCLLSGDDPSKGGVTLLDAGSIELHFVQGVLVNDLLKRGGSRTRAAAARVGRDLGWSCSLKVMGVSVHESVFAAWWI